MELVVRPVGFVRSPHREKMEAPRQGSVAHGVAGRVELLPAYEHALADLAGFERIWLLFWFDRVTRESAPNKVLPPRSGIKRGVFATRSPHRPNPIGMTSVRLLRVEGLVLHVADLDLLEGTPVLDVKPYLAYADAFPDSGAGWLEADDPKKGWDVMFEEPAEAQLAWVAENGVPELRERIVTVLSLGPEPHPYRRIKRTARGLELAVKEWRAPFRVDERRVVVERLRSGFRARELVAPEDPVRALHSAFAARFG